AAIRRFVDTQCWSTAKGSYVGYAGGEDLDASLLLMAIRRYDEPESPRLRGTVEAIRRELSRGPLLYRYTGDDGLAGGDGAFLCCSTWLSDASAIAVRSHTTDQRIEEMNELACDVTVYDRQHDPARATL